MQKIKESKRYGRTKRNQDKGTRIVREREREIEEGGERECL